MARLALPTPLLIVLTLALGALFLPPARAVAAEARPVVVILADPRGTETTDLIAPYAILAESGAVDVKVVAAEAVPIRLMPGVAWVTPHATLAAFDAAHPDGPDMVIIPFMMPANDPVRDNWLLAQARRGSRIVSICAGAETLARLGLLKDRTATTHWFVMGGLERRHRDVGWRRDARWITDGHVTTTAGVTASIPASLALLAELAGEPVMRATAARLALAQPDPVHDAGLFRVDRRAVTTGLAALLNFWRRDRVALTLGDGFDDLTFAVALDGWSRTFRSTAYAVAPSGATSRHGLTVFGLAKPPRMTRTTSQRQGEPVEVVLADIATAYGAPTARFVALNIEHPYWLTGR